MAIQARIRATSATDVADRNAEPLHVATPAVAGASPVLERLLAVVPLTITLVLSSALFWMPLVRSTAGFIAVALTLFFIYWAVRSYLTLLGCIISMRRITRWGRRDWRAEYLDRLASLSPKQRAQAEAWDWARHLVVIPNYKEDESGLRRLLQSLAEQSNPQQMVVVLAMEAREADAQRKATHLLLEFRGRFADCFATYHPADLEGEAPGKGSNEAWGVRRAYERLIDGAAQPAAELARYTVTSCDADSIFSPHHFEALNFLFLTAPDRYRTFWQPAITNSNNIWDIPAPLRIMEGLGSVNRLSNLTLPVTIPFPTSCYALSWQMLHLVDYWDEEVIPEDWHIFLKCSFALGDRVRMHSMYVRIGNDCVLTDGYFRTLKARYLQTVRHAWGCVDLPYAWRGFWRGFSRQGSPLGWRRSLSLAFSVTHVHSLWASQWFFVTLGVTVPTWLVVYAQAPMPDWWSASTYSIPGLSLHLGAFADPARWLIWGVDGLFDPVMRFSLPGLIVSSCLIPLVGLVVVELRVRGERPAHFSNVAYVRQFLTLFLMAPITLVWGALPAVQAQWRLATGKGLVYRVAEKGTRESVRAAASGPVAVPGGAAVASVAVTAADYQAMVRAGVMCEEPTQRATVESDVSIL